VTAAQEGGVMKSVAALSIPALLCGHKESEQSAYERGRAEGRMEAQQAR